MIVDVPNLEDVKDLFDPIPEGRYTFTVVKVEKKVGEDSGYDYLNWETSCQDSEYQNKRVWLITSLKPETEDSKDARFMLKRFLNALSVDYAGGAFDTDDCLNQKVDFQVTVEEYEGKPKNVVTGIFPASA